MVQRKGDIPVITHTIPRIEVYQVTEDELQRIEDGTSQVAQDFAVMLTSISACIAFLIALGTGTFDATRGLSFRAAIGVFGVTAIYTGWKWLRHRKTAANVIKKIHSRKEDPEIQ